MSASGADRASTCPARGGALEPETAGFTEEGLVWQRLRRGDAKAGPYTLAQLGALWEAGRVEPTDEYWCEGMHAWRPVSQFVSPHDPF